MPLILRPTGRATHREAKRDTALGSLWESTYRWVTPEGYALSWTNTVGRFGEYDDNVIALRVRVENLTDKPIRLRHMTLGQSARAFSCQGELSDWYLSSLHSTPLRGDLAQKPLIPAGQRGIWENFFEIPPVCFEEARDVRVFRDTVTLYAEDGAEGMTMGAVGIVSDVSFWFGLPETYLLPDLPLGFPEMDILDEEEAEMFADEDE